MKRREIRIYQALDDGPALALMDPSNLQTIQQKTRIKNTQSNNRQNRLNMAEEPYTPRCNNSC